MGDPVTAALVVGTVASTAVSAGAAYQQGQAAEAAAEAEARQREIQAENAQIASAQEEAQRRQELTDTLETIQSIRASRGLQQRSPTGQAITRENIRRGQRDIQIGAFNRQQQASRSRMAAEAARGRGSAAATGGMLRAGSSLLSGATRGLTLAQSPPSSGGGQQLTGRTFPRAGGMEGIT